MPLVEAVTIPRVATDAMDGELMPTEMIDSPAAAMLDAPARWVPALRPQIETYVDA